MVSVSRRALLAAAGVAASWPARAASSTWDTIQQTGVMRFGVMRSHAPYHDFQDGKWSGFAIQMGLDSMAEVGRAMQKELRAEYVETSFTTVILDLQSAKIDLYFGLTASPERAQAVNLIGPIYALPEVAINARSFNPGDQWADYDKPTVSVSVVLGSTDEQAARKMLPHADIRALKTTAESIMDIQSGHAQTTINTLLSGLQAAKRNPSLSSPIVLQPVISQPSTAGTRKDGDGKFAAFMDQWAKSYRESGRSKAVILEAMHEFGLDTASLPPTLQF